MSVTWLTGTNVNERHETLINSIGAFQEEIEAYAQIKVMIGVAYTLLLLFTVTQIMTYFLYNGKLHPFSVIISLDNEMLKTENKPTEEMTSSTQKFLQKIVQIVKSW